MAVFLAVVEPPETSGSATFAQTQSAENPAQLIPLTKAPMQVHRISSPQAPELDAALAIRKTVFVLGQNVPADLENDAHDRTDATHYLAQATDGTPCGTARWRVTEKGVKLERFAVLEGFRNQQVGAALLAAVLQDVDAAYPHATVYLNAQLPAVRFYERHNFEKVGEQFTEAGIEHYTMVWKRP
ncbi:GNAT family N-acetyltransferase [Hymenobacter seoulensis]